jgi:hypothetical protein
MIWLLIGLLTAFVIGFFVYFFVIRWNRLERFGSVAVPGDEVVELPAGRVVVYYQDSERYRYSQVPEPSAGFSVLVSEEGGGARVDLGEAPHSAIYKARGKTRIPYATLDLPHAGRYRIRSQVGPGAPEPRITLG